MFKQLIKKSSNVYYNMKRREARKRFHENHGKNVYFVVSNHSINTISRNTEIEVFTKDTYNKHSSLKNKYPFILATYQ